MIRLAEKSCSADRLLRGSVQAQGSRLPELVTRAESWTKSVRNEDKWRGRDDPRGGGRRLNLETENSKRRSDIEGAP